MGKEKQEQSDNVLMFTFPTPGISGGFGRPIVTLKGFENLDNKESKRFYELMDEIKCECQKLELHFKSELYNIGNERTPTLSEHLKIGIE